MIKSELVTILSDKNPHLYNAAVDKVVNVIFSEISNALADGKRVENASINRNRRYDRAQYKPFNRRLKRLAPKQ